MGLGVAPGVDHGVERILVSRVIDLLLTYVWVGMARMNEHRAG